MISVAVVLIVVTITILYIILYTSNFLIMTHEEEGIKVQEDALEVQEFYNDRAGEIADKWVIEYTTYWICLNFLYREAQYVDIIYYEIITMRKINFASFLCLNI